LKYLKYRISQRRNVGAKEAEMREIEEGRGELRPKTERRGIKTKMLYLC
jgi:hypothetical protein